MCTIIFLLLKVNLSTSSNPLLSIYIPSLINIIFSFYKNKIRSEKGYSPKMQFRPIVSFSSLTGVSLISLEPKQFRVNHKQYDKNEPNHYV